MRFCWLSAVKDLRRYRRDPPALALWLLLPLVIAGMIGLVFGRGGARPRGLLLIADDDRGLAGAFMRESISRGPLGTMLAIQQVDRAEGRKRLGRGDGSALLIIPKGYDRAVVRDEPAQLTLVTNPEQRLMPEVIRETASSMVSAASYIQQIAGSQLRALGGARHVSYSDAGLPARDRLVGLRVRGGLLCAAAVAAMAGRSAHCDYGGRHDYGSPGHARRQLFSLETMPRGFANFGHMIPNGWMLVQLQSILAGPVPAADLAREFGVLLVAGAVLFALNRRALARRLAA